MQTSALKLFGGRYAFSSSIQKSIRHLWPLQGSSSILRQQALNTFPTMLFSSHRTLLKNEEKEDNDEEVITNEEDDNADKEASNSSNKKNKTNRKKNKNTPSTNETKPTIPPIVGANSLVEFNDTSNSL